MKRLEMLRRKICICENHECRATHLICCRVKTFPLPKKLPANTLYLGPRNRLPSDLRLATSSNVFKTAIRKKNRKTLLDHGDAEAAMYAIINELGFVTCKKTKF